MLAMLDPDGIAESDPAVSLQRGIDADKEFRAAGAEGHDRQSDEQA
jgi:hypothetical protein